MNQEPTKPTRMPAGGEPEDADEAAVFRSFVALGFILLVVAFGVWLFSAYQENQRIQHCFLEHRQDCVPLDTSMKE